MRSLMLSALLLATSHSVNASLDEAIAHYDKMRNEQAMAILQRIDSAQSAAYQTKILMEIDLDDAEDYIESAIDTFPDAAELQFLRGRVMGQQAGNAIFSALSYADKSQQSFAKAVEMEPENIQYNFGLMMFHLNAPSIAGGDIAIARAQAEKIAKLDKEQGAIAQFRLIRASEDDNKTEQLIAVAEQHPDVAALQFELAQWFQRQERYTDAFVSYEKALENTADEQPKTQCDIWYQYGKTAGLANQNHQQGVGHLDNYLKHCDITRGMPSKEWATFRRANIIEHENKADALAIYRSLKSTQDKDLKKALKKKKV